MRTCVFAIALIALAACTYPYDTPVIEEGLGFRGVQNYLGEDPVRVVATHGMCSGDAHASGRIDETNWVARRATQMAAALGAPLDIGSEPTLTPTRTYPPDARTTGVPAVERYDFTFAAPGGSVEASFLVWGRHVDPYRAALDYEAGSGDGGPGGKPIRAPLNATLKTELMNRCLIDAVVYLGSNGDPIRRNMRWALCDILGGRFAATRDAGVAGIDAGCAAAEGFDGPAVLIPESLGSTILFDAFNDISRPAAARGAARVRSIFLASNQVPFLRQGNQPLPGAADGDRRTRTAGRAGDSLTEFLGLLPRAGLRARDERDGPAGPVELVAITDPNDVLGYRLTPDAVRGTDVALRNVLVSNAPTVLGTVANPIAAHRNTARRQVFDLIVHGHP